MSFISLFNNFLAFLSIQRHFLILRRVALHIYILICCFEFLIVQQTKNLIKTMVRVNAIGLPWWRSG